MPDLQEEYSAARHQLRPEKAERWARHLRPLWREDELVSFWPDVSEKLHRECVSFLYDYCDVSNWDTNAKKRMWVDNPTVGNEVHNGRWRLVEAFYDKNRRGQMGIVRRLRKGFAVTPEWDEALVLNADDLQEDERYITVAFPNIDPRYTDSVMTALGTTLVDPTIHGEQRSGTWEIIHRRPRKTEDGAIMVECVLAQPEFTVTTFSGLDTPAATVIRYLWNVPKRTAQTIIDGYESGTGTSAIANYSTAEGLVDITIRERASGAIITIRLLQTHSSCLEDHYDDYYYGLTQAEAESFDIGTAPQGWIYELVSHRYAAESGWMVHTRRRQAIAKTVSDERHVRARDEIDEYETEKMNQTTAPALSDIGAAVTGRERTITGVQLNQFCLYDWTGRYRDVHVLSGNEWEKTAEYAESISTQQHGAALTEPSQTDGALTERINVPDGFGLYNTRDRTRTFSVLSSTSWEKTAEFAETDSRVQHGDALTEPTQVDGRRRVSVNTPDGFGKYDTRSIERVFAALAGGVWRKRAEEETQIATVSHATDALAEPSQIAGRERERSSQPDGFGWYNTTTRETLMKELSASSYGERAEYSETTSTVRHGSALSQPTQETGKDKERVNAIDGFGKYNTQSRVRTYKLLSASSRTVARGYTEDETNKLHATAGTLPTGWDATLSESEREDIIGHIRSTVNRPDGFGKYAVTTSDRQHHDLSEVGRDYGDDPWTIGNGRYYHKDNNWKEEGVFLDGVAEIPDDPPSLGVLVARRNNSDGLYYGYMRKRSWIGGATQPSIRQPDADWDSFDALAQTSELRQYATVDGVRKKRTVTLTYNVKQTEHASTAYAAINGGKHGSRVDMFTNAYGPYGFRAITITAIEEGAWEDDI